MSDVVYFVKRGALVKIGTTGGIDTRIVQLNTGSSMADGMDASPVELLATMPGGRPVERSIHEMFAGLRYEGEWFFVEEPLVGFIQAVAAAEAVAQARRERAFPRQRTPWTYVDTTRVRTHLDTADALRAQLRADLLTSEVLTLKDAVEIGVLPWSYEAAKKRLQRDRTNAPPPCGKRGSADLFHRSDLAAWAALSGGPS